MTIGIDIRILGSRNRSGIVEYTEEIVRGMIAAAPEHQFKLFYSSSRHRLPNYAWLKADNVKLYYFKVSNNLLFLSNRLFNWPKLDLMLGGADVFFSPHFFLVSLSRKCRHVVVFHDLSFCRFPEFLNFRRRWWHAFMSPKRQAWLADRIIAVSESTEADLIKIYGIDSSKISVIYSGLSLKPFAEDLEKFRTEHNLPKRFIFSLGTLEPRKNVLGLILAFEKIASRIPDCDLVIAGARGWLDKEIFKKIKKSKFCSRIRFVGQISDQDRAGYYASASVFVYPSFFEGFGFPILEAMVCGTPVVTARNSSLPEVAGSAALLIDPYDISEMSEAVIYILENAEIRNRLIVLGREQAKHFTWPQAVQGTLGVVGISPQR